MRAKADARFPDEQAPDEDYTEALQSLERKIMQLADQDVLLVKARRRNDLEVLLLTAPVRALYKTPMMQFYRECSSIALCLALVATMPKRLACLKSHFEHDQELLSGQQAVLEAPDATAAECAARVLQPFIVGSYNRLGELLEDCALSDNDPAREAAILFYRRCLTLSQHWELHHQCRVAMCNLGVALKRAGLLRAALKMYSAAGNDADAQVLGAISNNSEILLEEMEEWRGTASEPWGARCIGCGKEESQQMRLLACSKCGLRRFCSMACMQATWKAPPPLQGETAASG